MDVKRRLEIVVGGNVDENYPFSLLTTFGTGGPAKYLVTPRTPQQAGEVLSLAEESGLPVFFLGGGSNILVSDRGFPGIVISTAGLRRVDIEGEKITAESGMRMASLMKISIQRSLAGAEFLAGIPGTLGGAVFGNAGLKDSWISGILDGVQVIGPGGGSSSMTPGMSGFSYRGSGLAGLFIYRVVIMLRRGEREEIKELVKSRILLRRESHPAGFCSAGSIFKNPRAAYAGKLIEEAGLKGLELGGAKVSERHANFIVNTGKATSSDIYGLILYIQKRVEKVYNVKLETEVKIIGEF